MEEYQIMECFKNTCRTCAYQFGELYDIPDNKDINYLEFLEDFGNISFTYEDGQPCQLCSSCLEKLDVSINFKLAIEKANTKLKNLLQSVQLDTVRTSEDINQFEFSEIKEYFSSDDEMCIVDYNEDNSYTSEDEGKPIKQKNKIKKQEKKVPVVSFLHRCRRCDTCFHTFDDLYDHSLKHPTLTPQETLICRFCQREFPHIRHLPIHIRKTHADDIVYKCGYCHKEFFDVKLIKSHIGVHMTSLQAATLKVTIPKKHVVRRRRRRRNSQNELVDIPVPKPTEDNAIIFCSVCRRFFPDVDALNKHMLDGHPAVLEVLASGDGWIATDKTIITPEREEDRPYACRLCDKRFLTASHMKRHEVAHDPEKPFACKFNLCRWKFPTPEELQLHEIVNHREDKDNVCPVCDKAHKHKRLLRQHMASHGNRQRYKCKHCQKGFNYKTHLLNHEASHTKEAQHLCQKCGKRFYIKDNFRQHVLRHNKKELPHACPHCPRRFLMPSQLRGHIKMHTGESDFMCHTCGMQIKSSAQLHNHMAIHKEAALEIRHCCNFCMRYFKKKTAYDLHMKTHESGARVHKCDYCPWMFTSPQLMREHVTNRHTNKARKRKIGIFSGVLPSTSNDSIPTTNTEQIISGTNSNHSIQSPNDVVSQSEPTDPNVKTELSVYTEQQIVTYQKITVVNPDIEQRIVPISPVTVPDPEPCEAEAPSEPHITISISNSNQIYIVPTYYQLQKNVHQK